MNFTPPTTGLPGLDYVLHGVAPGDNIVWAVEKIENYRSLVNPFIQAAQSSRRPLVYFRFGSHPALMAKDSGAEIHEIDPRQGFEKFVRAVHTVIEARSIGACYVFDSLSDLADVWLSDQAVGNFFMLTCPRLKELETITYFAVLRDYHSLYALEPIRITTQFFIEVFQLRERIYVRPLEVERRSREAVNVLYRWDDEAFLPVKESAEIADILSRTQWPRLQNDRRIGYWRRLFRSVEQTLGNMRTGRRDPQIEEYVLQQVRRAFRVHHSGIAPLVERYLTLEDFHAVRDRMIGIGSVGGKTLGMLVARAFVREQDPELAGRLEAHDSFFVGAEVFMTFLVRNKVWKLRELLKLNPDSTSTREEGRRLIHQGEFPDDVLKQFAGMLDYFGESPYIVRSSSILEDALGNAFSGKYESVFVVNHGTTEERMAALLDAVRTVYSSVLDHEALIYRKRRGLLDSEERMALLIMRVSGSLHGKRYFPQAAGVALSRNPYVWHKEIDPKAGVVRLVLGLGTRAVDRSDDDYTRLVALNAPSRRPESGIADVREHSQRRMDCLDLGENKLVSCPIDDVFAEKSDFPPELYLTRTEDGRWITTFDHLLQETNVPKDLRRILELLEAAYGKPVDVEFCLNFLPDGSYRIHLLQCRSFQFHENTDTPMLEIPKGGRKLLVANGAVIGLGRSQRLKRIVAVSPDGYSQLSEQDRYAVARVIGKISRMQEDDANDLMLIGPGRWGTSTPSLGIPVRFAEINRASVICEVVAMHKGLVPDVSLGTHFFNDLVEHDVLYLAYFPERPDNILDLEWFVSQPNQLETLIPSAKKWSQIIHVIDANDEHPLWFRADPTTQECEVTL
jgi:hypothetical protein